MRKPSTFKEKLEAFTVIKLDISRHIRSLLGSQSPNRDEELNCLLGLACLRIDKAYPLTWTEEFDPEVDEEYRVRWNYSLIQAPDVDYSSLSECEGEAIARALSTPGVIQASPHRHLRLLKIGRTPKCGDAVRRVTKEVEEMSRRLQTVWSAAEALLQHDGTLEEKVKDLLAHAVEIPSHWGKKWFEVEVVLDHWLSERSLAKASSDDLEQVLALLRQYEMERENDGHDLSYYVPRLERQLIEWEND